MNQPAVDLHQMAKTIAQAAGQLAEALAHPAPVPPQPRDEVILLDAREVAKVLSISERFAYTLMERGDISCVRLGRAIRASRRAVEQYVTNLEAEQRRKTWRMKE